MEKIIKSNKLKIALVVPVFPPYISSASQQINDLAIQLNENRYSVTIFVPTPNIKKSFIEKLDGVSVIRLKTFQSIDTNYFIRFFSEFITPFLMIKQSKLLKLNVSDFGGIVWYSPSIFLFHFVKFLKKNSNCKSYLILRDIFPEWILNLNLISKNLPYYFLKFIEKKQYLLADNIGIQSKKDELYFRNNFPKISPKVELLHNWLSLHKKKKCTIDINKTKLAKRKIFLYAGNIGVAQNLDIFIELAKILNFRADIGFIFVGRGSEKTKLENQVLNSNLSNTLFYNEIHPDEMYDLYKQSFFGIVCLDKRHKTNNVPGKFISYISSGLPVFAIVNPGNDLRNTINKKKVGYATSNYNINHLLRKIIYLIDHINIKAYENNCKSLYYANYLPSLAAMQITNKFNTIKK